MNAAYRNPPLGFLFPPSLLYVYRAHVMVAIFGTRGTAIALIEKATISRADPDALFRIQINSEGSDGFHNWGMWAIEVKNRGRMSPFIRVPPENLHDGRWNVINFTA